MFRRFATTITFSSLLFSCSLSGAVEPPKAHHSYLAEHMRIHRAICGSYQAEFQLRSDWENERGPQRLSFESAEFNGKKIQIAPELHNIFEYLVETEVIFADCVDEKQSIGVSLTALTKFKEMPTVRLYFDLTASGLVYREMVCEPVKFTNSVPQSFYEYCGKKKW